MDAKPNDPKKKPEPSPADEIAADARKLDLSEDPFSIDNEVTVIQIANKIIPQDASEEMTEITTINDLPSFNADDTEPRLKNPPPLVSEEVSTSHKSNSIIKTLSKPIAKKKQRQITLSTLPWRELKRFITARNLKIFSGILGIVVLFWVLNLGWKSWSPFDTTAKAPQKNSSTAMALLQLSKLEYEPPHYKAWPFRARAGQTFTLRFTIDNWAKPPKDDLNFVGDLRIYSSLGKLLHYKPKYAQFFGRVDAKTEKIEIENTIRLSPKTPSGLYRVMFDVTEKNTNQRASLQTRIQVISQE